MKIKSVLFLTVFSLLFACSSKDNAKTTTSTKDSKANVKENEKTAKSSTSTVWEGSISDIKKEFQNTEENLKSYTTKTAEVEVEGGGTAEFIGYYDKDGLPRKVTHEEAMGHGAFINSYFLKNGKAYFVFEESASEASVMGPFTFNEKRIYLQDGNVIRLLEKEKTVKGNEDAKMSDVPNKDLTATLKDKSGKVYLDEVEKILKALGNVSNSKATELSFENTRWKSTDDPKSVIEVKGGKWNSLYDEEKLSTGDYKVEKKSDGLVLTINEGEEVYKYNIIKHTETELQMAMIGGRGNTLSYEKY